MSWKGLFFGGPIVALAEELLSSDSNNDTPSQPTITEDEVERIRRIIEDGRRRGVSEIDIEVSQEFAGKFDLSSATAIDAIPVSVGIHVDRSRAGKCVLHVKYLPPDATDRIRELHRLHKDGALTEKEFEQAKQQVLSRI